MNHVTLMGNLTREPQLKHLNSGAAVCEFGLAINKKWTDKSGNKQESVCFVDCTCWNRTAEIANQYLSKGRKTLIEGELKLDQWEDKNGGGKRSKLSVTVNRLHLLPGGQGDSQQSGYASSGEQSQAAVDSFYGEEPQGTAADDVPF